MKRWFISWFLVAGLLSLVGAHGAAQAQAQKGKVTTPTGRTYFTGRKPLPPQLLKQIHDKAAQRHGNLITRLPKATAQTFDARTLGWVPPIRDQGQCGSCWDFSGSGVVTSALIKAGQIPNSSNGCSEQYTLDCGSNGGCGGDDNITVLQWAKATGLPLDKDYGVTYQASAGRCQSTSSLKLWKISDWGFCTPNQQQGVAATQDIKNALVAYGPIGLGIDANVLGDGTGIVSGTGHNIDHDVIVVGWDDTKGWRKNAQTEVPLGSQFFTRLGGFNVVGGRTFQTQVVLGSGVWIMRNSWGTGWGQACGGTEGGYCYITYGSGDIGTEACWAVAQAVGPPPPPPNPWIFRAGIGLPNAACCGQQMVAAPLPRATCSCNGDPSICTCGGNCQCVGGASCQTAAPKCDTRVIYRDPGTWRRWQYTDALGNWRWVDPAPQSFLMPSFGVRLFGGAACST